jgi:hypothetical protein
MTNWWTKRVETLLDKEITLYGELMEGYKKQVVSLMMRGKITDAEIKSDIKNIMDSHGERMARLFKFRKICMLMDKKDSLVLDKE